MKLSAPVLLLAVLVFGASAAFAAEPVRSVSPDPASSIDAPRNEGASREAEILRESVLSADERQAMVRAILEMDLPAPRRVVSVPSERPDTFEEGMSQNGWNPANPANQGFRNVEKIVERHQLQELERTLNPASRGDRR